MRRRGSDAHIPGVMCGPVRVTGIGFAVAVVAITAVVVPGVGATSPAVAVNGLHKCSFPSDNIYAVRANVNCGRARDVISHVRCHDGCTKWKSRKFKCRHEPVPSREGANFRCRNGGDVVKWKTRS
jgi:hypothetical protein